MTNPHDRSTPRAVRMAQPLAREVAEEIAKQYGVCIRPVPLRRQDILTGQVEVIDVPCGATLESKCPPCAKRNRHLRMAQCREGLAPRPRTGQPPRQRRRLSATPRGAAGRCPGVAG